MPSPSSLGRFKLADSALGRLSPIQSSGTIIEYQPYIGSSKWIEERGKFELRLVDSILSRSMMLELIMADFLNSREGTYFRFQNIRAKDISTREIIFLGRVEQLDPIFDSTYGQALRIIAFDYQHELKNRLMNSNYVAQIRSNIIDDIIDNYVYPGNLTKDIDPSGSAETVGRDYQNANTSALGAIEEVAIEDPWSDDAFGAAWLWDNSVIAWVNDTVECASAGGVAFDVLGQTTDYFYFGLNVPFWGVIVDLSTLGSYSNISWEYWNGFEWAIFYPDLYYSFEVDSTIRWYAPDDWRSRTITNGDPHGAAPPDGTSRYWVRVYAAGVTTVATALQMLPIIGYGYDYYTDESQVFHYFKRGDLPVGGAGTHISIFSDAFGVAVAAPVNTIDWIGENYSGGAENSTADINTAVAGKAYVLADPDGTPIATGYWLRYKQALNTKHFTIIADASYTWGTPNTDDLYGGLIFTKGNTFDANNYLYVARMKNDSPGDVLVVRGVLNGAPITPVEVAVIDDTIGFRLRRVDNVWTFYYSASQSTNYSWIVAAIVNDSSNYMSNTVSVALFSYSPGNADNQSLQIDFDNFNYYDQSGLTLQYGGSASSHVIPMFGDYIFPENAGEIWTRVIVEGITAGGVRVEGTATDTDLEDAMQIVRQKKITIRNVSSASDCTKKAEAVLAMSRDTVKRGTVSFPRYPVYVSGGVIHFLRAGETVHIIIGNKGINHDWIVVELTYEEPPGRSKVLLMNRRQGLIAVPFSLESTIEDITRRLERAEQIV